MPAASDSPNVLLVCTDHWPGRLLGAAGHPTVITPTLDQLAASGIRYPNAYSECPVCIPARRTLMTGLTPRGHGVRDNRAAPMPEVPTLARCFREAGYQATAVGKLHGTPQRNRIGFDDVRLDEEGRAHPDDYEVFLADQGFAGERYAGGMSNNAYVLRPWHLPESAHVTNWATRETCRSILRKDPTRPAFWYLSYSHPHPPLEPLQAYLDLYRDEPIPEPLSAAWQDRASLPLPSREPQSETERRRLHAVRRAFYALCTHIDHQLRVVIGTLAREGHLDHTIILFTSDHGDLLGDFGLWAKRRFFEGAANVPMILSLPPRLLGEGVDREDPRLVQWADVMPTLLDLCGIPVPAHCEGRSMLAAPRREFLYGECAELKSPGATRMIRKGDHKLIYFPHGNSRLLFDLRQDPDELHDLSEQPEAEPILTELTRILVEELRPLDAELLEGDHLRGLPPLPPSANRASLRGLSGQRGLRWL